MPKKIKADVRMETWVNGVHKATEILKDRTVYVYANGAMRVNYCGGYRMVTRDELGEILWRFEIQTGTAMSAGDWVKGLRERYGAA